MDTFTVITWPDIQEYMDKPGFSENSCLINEEPMLSAYGSSAYFVRVSWLDPYSDLSDEELKEIFEDQVASDAIDNMKSEYYF